MTFFRLFAGFLLQVIPFAVLAFIPTANIFASLKNTLLS